MDPEDRAGRCSLGLIYLAAQTGLPIVPIGFGWQRAWRMKSWDRFAVPVPFSAASCVTTEPIHVPQTTDRDQLEVYRCNVQEAMDRATVTAQRMFEKPILTDEPEQRNAA